MPVILAAQETEIRRVVIHQQVRPYLEKTQHKKRAGGIAQVVEYLASSGKTHL
jgi:hypothetical protein